MRPELIPLADLLAGVAYRRLRERALKEEMQQRAEAATPDRSHGNVTEKSAEVDTVTTSETVKGDPADEPTNRR